MISTRYHTYTYTIPYQKQQSQMKDLSGALILTEKNDADNDVYRNAVTKATQAADIDRYSQGTFDLSLLVAGYNANSYFAGTMSSAYDVDYFHVDTSSQILSRRPVLINMEMPEGADYDLTVYDNQGNQVGMAVANEDGTKTLVIPCDWSNCRDFVIKVRQHDSGNNVEGTYKLTFSQGEMPRETMQWMERMKTAKVVETTPEERWALGKAVKEKNDARNAEGIRRLHQEQYDALTEECKYNGDLSVEELLEKEKNGETLSEAERAYIAIYGNQNDIYRAESMRRKYGLEQEFGDFLDSVGLSEKSFAIRLTASGNAEISGLDEEQQKLVEDYVTAHWNLFKNVYLSISEETAAMTDQQYRIAGYVEECNRFLANTSNGKISVDDLSIQREYAGWYLSSEEITGLPSAVAQLINGADSTSRFYDYKQMLYRILEYQKVHGEIPQYHMNFDWNGKELQYGKKDEVEISQEGQYAALHGEIDDQLKTAIHDENFVALINEIKERKKGSLPVNWDKMVDPDGKIFGAAYVEAVVRQYMCAENTIKAYYAEAHKENLSFADPYNHILEKYKRGLFPVSPYFRSDMSEAERNMAFEQERALLWGGSITIGDPYALASSGGVLNIKDVDRIALQAARDKIDQLIQERKETLNYGNYS